MPWLGYRRAAAAVDTVPAVRCRSQKGSLRSLVGTRPALNCVPLRCITLQVRYLDGCFYSDKQSAGTAMSAVPMGWGIGDGNLTGWHLVDASGHPLLPGATHCSSFALACFGA